MVVRRKNIVSFWSLAHMSISTYLRPNFTKTALKFYEIIFSFLVPQVETILTMPRAGNRRRIAASLDMVIFESDEYALPKWNMLSPHKDRLWTLKQCKKIHHRISYCKIVVLWWHGRNLGLAGSLGIPYDSMCHSRVCSTVYRGDFVYQGGGAKTFPRVLIATSQWYMQSWCLGSIWIGPRW